MSILVSLILGASAAVFPADRLFDAPEDISALEQFGGQPAWILLTRCAKTHFEDAERLQNSQATALDETMARNEGTTVEARRAAELQRHEEAVVQYLSIAIQSVAADRNIEIEDANSIVVAEVPKVDALRSSYSSMFGAVDSCDTIASRVAAS